MKTPADDTRRALKLCLVPGTMAPDFSGPLLRRAFPAFWITDHRLPEGTRGGVAPDTAARQDAFIFGPRPLAASHPLAALRAADRQHLVAWPVLDDDGLPRAWVVEPGRGGLHDAWDIRARKPARAVARVFGIRLPRGRGTVLPAASLATPSFQGAMARLASRLGGGKWGTSSWAGRKTQHPGVVDAMLALRSGSGHVLQAVPAGFAELAARGACAAPATCLQAPVILSSGKLFAQSLHDPARGGEGLAATLAAAISAVSLLGRAEVARPLALALAIAARTPSLRVRDFGGEVPDALLADFIAGRLEGPGSGSQEAQVQLDLL